MRHVTLLLAPFLLALTSDAARAGECCDRCGCDGHCHKVCRLVCEEKTIEVTCWTAECEDFCIPGRSCKTCQHCGQACTNCDSGQGCGCCDKCAPKKFVWWEWCPGTAHLAAKKKLMRKMIEKKVPSYKWVVEDCCPSCAAEPGSCVKPAPTEANRGDELPVSDEELANIEKDFPPVRLPAIDVPTGP